MLKRLTGFTKGSGLSGRSLGWRLLLPLPVAMVVAILCVWFVVPGVVRNNATAEAINTGQQTAAQFKQIRAYYTENVVGKIVKDGTFKAVIDHRSNEKSIPLPATMIHELSELLAKQDTTINLYSAYPFPNRASRKLDDFQQAAWNALTKDPVAVFSRNETRNDVRPSLRYLPQYPGVIAEERLETG
jgi:methyl-accepting chemotaxis protein